VKRQDALILHVMQLGIYRPERTGRPERWAVHDLSQPLFDPGTARRGVLESEAQVNAQGEEMASTSAAQAKKAAEHTESAAQTTAVAATRTASAAQQTKDSADRRTELAADRTMFAAERTYAAWVRTGLVALASGIGARKLLEGVVPAWMVIGTGTILILFSALCFVAGVWRQVFVGAPPPNPDVSRLPPMILATVNGFLALVALAALVGIWSMTGQSAP
jgi:putative membrane protein